ncbi:hypothetical protein HW555_008339 [Spodoptera exigua]|uniref:Uncharacterized protein n=1 Tax=Spodoptera exigua TaxID=7107 RepID=A0A835GF33_SPOEX|nr:hypothetical protein HW555_008339 [Spodoptera exigua]
MRIICSDQVTPAVIDGTGVIALKPKCLLQKKDATIFTYNHLGSKVNTGVDIEVPIINTTINKMFDLGWRNVQLNITEFNNAADLEKIERQISNLKQHEVLPESSGMSPHDVYFYSATTVLLVGPAVAGVYFIIKKLRISTNQNSMKVDTNMVQDKRADKEEVNIEMREMRSSTRHEPRKGFSFDEIPSY